MMPALVREGRLTGFAMRYLGRLVAYLAVFFITFSLGYTLLLRWVQVTLTPLKAIRLAEHLPEEGLRVRSNWVPLRKVAMPMVRAVIATEDNHFLSHRGFDWDAIDRALDENREGKRLLGGSTISQQLAKNLYPRDTAAYNNPISKGSKLVISKLKEWITAVMLERNYTKEEIIAMYLNTVEYGSNAYGIKSAARTFFNKLPSELNAEESAMLVGVVNKPTRYSPVQNPDRALARRNLVIARMKQQGYIDRHQRDSLQALPIDLDYHPVSHNEGTATYFREMLRMVMTAKRPTRNQFLNEWDYDQAVKQWDTNPLYGWCVKNVKSDGTPYNLYRDGLKIYTTINATMQEYAEDALVAHMSKEIQPTMDRQVRATKRLFNDIGKDEIDRIMRNAMRQTDRYRALKNDGASDEEIMSEFKKPVKMKVFSYKGERDTTMSPYDSILYHKQILRASFMAIDPSTGYVKAYVGGPNYRYFKYDMAKQGKRQVGSTIKPFIYTFAIAHLGYDPCTLVPNLPVTIETDNGTIWQPKEAGRVEYTGELKPLWWGLANSRNNYSAWIMKQARQPQAVADYIHKMGIKSYIDPVYSLCLGTPDFSLFELVGAYGTFANRGVFTDPIFVTRIEDRNGNVLATFAPALQDAISEQTAFTMLGMMKNVVTSGTAGRLRWMYGFKADMAGKTGTSQKNSDAWFMGVTPKIVAGAWVGGEDRSVHLNGAGDGARVALPIFAGFMKKIYGDPSLGVSESDLFPVPVGAVVYQCNEEKGTATAVPREEDEFFD